MVILSADDAIKLKKYAYRGGDTSPIYIYFLSPFAQSLLMIVPEYVAPNLITFIGLCFPLFACMMTIYMNPHLNSDENSWIHLLSALAILFYQTMDNMDGKQARRTNSSSALGMIFDHCCDAINAGIFSIPMASALCTGWTLGIFFGLWCGFTPFYFQTWEEHHIGAMFLPPFNGPTEGLLIASCMCFVSFWKGSSFWQHVLFNIPGGQDIQASPFSVMFLIAIVGALITCGIQVGRVSTLILSRKVNAYHDLLVALSELAPFIVFFSSSVLWCHRSQIALQQYPILTIALISSVFVEIVVHMMLATVCDRRICPGQRFLAWGMLIPAMNVLLPLTARVDERWILFPLFSVSTSWTAIFLYRIVTEVADALDIYVFVLGKKSRLVAQKSARVDKFI